ncbi:MAG: hypothetical protein ABTD50_22665 [Polyangiaceae bacterium]
MGAKRAAAAAMISAILVHAHVHVAFAADLAISPASATLAPRATQAFAASGGSASGYVWSMAAAPSGGTVTSSGLYTAGPAPNVVDQVQVTDSLLNVATANVTVTASLSIAPPGITLAPGNVQQFIASGGSPPYSWSLVANASGGTVSSSGLYTSGPTVGNDTVRVADSVGSAFTVPVDVVAAVPLGTPCTSAGTCPATASGNAYCVDGVCCDSVCSGQCQACNTAQSIGSCVTIAGPSVLPRPACPMSDSNNVCTQTICDGLNPTSCAQLVGADVVCVVATCIDGVGTPSAVCDGDGGCPEVDASSCGTYACIAGACAASCTNTSECSPGNYCDVTSATCVSPLPSDLPDAEPASASTTSGTGCGIVRAGYAHSLTLAPLFCGAILARRRRRLSPTETRKRARR